MSRWLFTAALLLVLGWTNPAAAQEWQLDPSHSSVSFTIRHLSISDVRGEFTRLTGSGTYDSKNIEKSTLDVTIDASSINTRDTKRDEHLRSADFFDVEKYPNITFKAKSFRANGKDAFIVDGELSMHGVTRNVALRGKYTPEIKDMQGNTRIGATATCVLKRKDYGITWNRSMDNGGQVLGEEVKVSLEVEFVKKK